jgi:hypothetical protein
VAATRVHADTRVTVHDFYGPNASRVRDDVVNLLERQSGVTIVSKGQIEEAAKKLGVDAYSPEGRKAVSRELNLSAWMTGMVQRRAGKLKLTVVVYDGAQHARVGRAQLIGRNASALRAQIRGHLWNKSRRAIMAAAAPDGDDSDPANKTATAEASARPDLIVTTADTERVRYKADSHDKPQGHNSSGEAMRVFIGVGSPYRSLAYNQPITSTLGNYQLSGAPMADLNFSFNPARFATDGWASWFGLDARAQIALSTPSFDRDGSQFRSRYDAFHVGVRARIPVGDHYVSAFSGYAMNRFSVSAENSAIKSPTPSVDYRSIRSGVGAELRVSNTMSLGLDVALLNYLSVGNIASWFPRATAAGVEAGMFATYAMTDTIFARAAAAYQRTFFDFNARPGDKYIAGGATDQYLAVSLGAGVQL